jgi:hypothetical protein
MNMSNFNKRHYEAIATAVQEALKEATRQEADGMYKLADVLATQFIRDNPLFKYERFIAACEPGANVRARRAS